MIEKSIPCSFCGEKAEPRLITSVCHGIYTTFAECIRCKRSVCAVARKAEEIAIAKWNIMMSEGGGKQ